MRSPLKDTRLCCAKITDQNRQVCDQFWWAATLMEARLLTESNFKQLICRYNTSASAFALLVCGRYGTGSLPDQERLIDPECEDFIDENRSGRALVSDGWGVCTFFGPGWKEFHEHPQEEQGQKSQGDCHQQAFACDEGHFVGCVAEEAFRE